MRKIVAVWATAHGGSLFRGYTVYTVVVESADGLVRVDMCDGEYIGLENKKVAEQQQLPAEQIWQAIQHWEF